MTDKRSLDDSEQVESHEETIVPPDDSRRFRSNRLHRYIAIITSTRAWRTLIKDVRRPEMSGGPARRALAPERAIAFVLNISRMQRTLACSNLTATAARVNTAHTLHALRTMQ